MVSTTKDTTSISGKVFINGQWESLPESKEVLNPALTSEVLGYLGLVSEEDINRAITAAEKAYGVWAQTPLNERIDRIQQPIEQLKKKVDEFTTMFVRENGKTLVEAKIDLLRSIEILEILPTQLEKWYEPVHIASGDQKVDIRRRPRGVTAVITPWNSPLILTMKRIIPAILTGNTVVLKPASNCPLTILSFMKELAVSLPKGVLNVITGSGSLVGDYLAKDTRVKTISFVGSTEIGKRLMEKAASTLKKLHLELGGNDPAVILSDAVLGDEEIVKIKNGVLKGAGQVCSAIKRIYVHRSRYAELLDKLGLEFSKTIVGEGIHPDATMGPLNNKEQFQFVKDLMQRTEKDGASIEYFGRKLNEEKWNKGYFMLPAIVTNINHDSELVKSEQFGPVIPIVPFDDEDEAIKYANDSEYGLRASVWTSDIEKAKRIADRLEAGAVFFNNHTIFKELLIDFPGVKESGIGRETNDGGFDHFTDAYGFAD